MIALVDTSVWIDHLHRTDATLVGLLEGGDVRIHPLVYGELACGSLRNRRVVLEALAALPRATVAADEEVLAWVEAHRLHGKGLGWIDVHLLAAAKLDGIGLWTRDGALTRAAQKCGVFAAFDA